MMRAARQGKLSPHAGRIAAGLFTQWDLTLAWIDRQSVFLFVLIAATLGLAPFVPEPHVWEKLKMLAAGTLTRPIDIFDLLLHGTPWLLLLLKLYRQLVLKLPPAA